MIEKKEYRLIATLAACQLLWLSAGAIILTLSGIIGQQLAFDKSYATLPFALMCLANAVLSMPAAAFMLRFGRKKGFLLGSIFGCLSGAVTGLAVAKASFGLFCLGVALWGAFMAFAQFYRYAAAEGVDAASKGTAISVVVGSSIVGVFVGPLLIDLTQNLFQLPPFTGSFLIVAGLSAVSLLVTGFLDIPPPPPKAAGPAMDRPQIAWQPNIVAGLVNGAVAFSVMVFVMTASPLATVHFGHSVADAAAVVQWHLLGMYGPSLVTGWLISRIGEVKILLLGIGLLFASLLTALQGTSMPHLSVALLLLGVGWNFMFVSASVLLSQPQDARARARVQAIGEFINNSTLTVAAFSAGSVFVNFGWTAVNLIVLPVLLLALLVTFRYALSVSRSRRRIA